MKLEPLFETVISGIAHLKIPFANNYTSAFLLSSPEGVILYDTGAGSRDVREWILPALEKAGAIPDEIVLSHFHADHSGGLPALLEAFPSSAARMFDEKLASGCVRSRLLTDGAILAGRYQVMHLGGHSADGAALFDPETGTLVCGDCLQLYGIDRYGTGLSDSAAYLQTIRRIRQKAPQNLITSHEYVPLGSRAFGPEKVRAYLDECIRDVEAVRDYIRAHQNLPVQKICEEFHQDFPDLPWMQPSTVKTVLTEDGIGMNEA